MASCVVLAGCRGNGAGRAGACRIDFTRIGGEDSLRHDILVQGQEPGTLLRYAFADGGDVVTDAIFYTHDDEGRLELSERDAGDDGELDQRLSRQEVLAGVIEVVQADANVEDDAVDILQFSGPLPGGQKIGPWAPARITFNAFCAPERILSAERDGDEVRVALDQDGDSEVDITMALVFEGERLVSWDVAAEDDPTTEKEEDARRLSALLFYSASGHIEEFMWKNGPGVFAGVTFRGQFLYDEAGRLKVYQADGEGDGSLDTQIYYSPECWSAP